MLDAGDLKALASADALLSLSGHRRQQVWDASALHRAPALLQGAPVYEKPLVLAAAHEAQEVLFDYAATGLTLRSHPLSFLRVWQRDEDSGGQVRHLIAKRLVDLTDWLGDLSAGSRDFR